MKKAIVILLVVISNTFYSQVGDLHVRNEYASIEFDFFTLSKNDSIYEQGKVTNGIWRDSIPVGDYCLNIYQEENLMVIFYNVIILNNETTEITLSSQYNYSNVRDTTKRKTTSEFEMSFNFKHSSPTIDFESPLIRNHLELSQMYSFFAVKKHLSIAYVFGFNYSFSLINRDTSFSDNPPYRNERFVYLSYSNGVIFRWTGYDNNKYSKNGPVVDLGVTYNLPLWMKYVTKKGNSKTQTNRLHKFNDVSAILKVGYGSIAFTAEYRFFDFVKPDYIQLPKLKFGIAVLLDAY